MWLFALDLPDFRLRSVARMFSLFLALCCQLCDGLRTSGLGSEDEVKLVKQLFDGYNELIRPVRNITTKVKVDIQLALIQIIDVNEKNQILKSNVWLRQSWQDYQLEWDPSNFGGITVIRILSDKVWKPDVVLFNNADGKYEVSYKPNVVIYNTGKVMWIPIAIYQSSCIINVEYFPFDEQECEMEFGSWTFNAEQVTLGWYEGESKVDLRDYVPSGSWDIIGCPGEIGEKNTMGESNVSVVTYKIRIRRKTLFYTVNLIIPCVLISFLSVGVFYLPSDAGEKMTMCISVLLALVVFLLLVSKILPPTSDTIPLIANYLLFTFVNNVVVIVFTVVIINWFFRTPRTHRMPGWIRVLFLNYLPRVILMKRPRHDERWGKKEYTIRHEAATAETESSSGRRKDKTTSSRLQDGRTTDKRPGDRDDGIGAPVSDSRHLPGVGSSVRVTAIRSSLYGMAGGENGCVADGVGDAQPSSFYDSAAADCDIPLTSETKKALDAVTFIAAHLKNEDDYSEVLDDWMYVASVIDRLQLYVFLAIIIAGTVGILIHAPHIFDFIDQSEIIHKILESEDGAPMSKD